MAFSCHEDKRRLHLAGLLDADAEDLKWLDVQRRFDRSGSPPSLQAVVAGALGCWMDKRLQTSNWDTRPLRAEQKVYAALDASVLLRLYGCQPSPRFWQLAAPHPRVATDVDAAEDAKDHWHQYRRHASRKRQQIFTGGAREQNADLCFLLPSNLTRLMRNRGPC